MFSWSFSTCFLRYCLFILYLFNVVDVFEYSKLIVLNFFVVFRLDFSTLKPNFLVTMEVLNACVSLDAHEDQNRYVWTTFQTIENVWDSDFFVGCNLFDFYAKCGNKKMWQNDYPLFFVQKLIFGWRNMTLLSLFSVQILKLKCTFLFHCVYMKKNVIEKDMKQKSCKDFNLMQITSD